MTTRYYVIHNDPKPRRYRCMCGSCVFDSARACPNDSTSVQNGEVFDDAPKVRGMTVKMIFGNDADMAYPIESLHKHLNAGKYISLVDRNDLQLGHKMELAGEPPHYLVRNFHDIWTMTVDAWLNQLSNEDIEKIVSKNPNLKSKIVDVRSLYPMENTYFAMAKVYSAPAAYECGGEAMLAQNVPAVSVQDTGAQDVLHERVSVQHIVQETISVQETQQPENKVSYIQDNNEHTNRLIQASNTIIYNNNAYIKNFGPKTIIFAEFETFIKSLYENTWGVGNVIGLMPTSELILNPDMPGCYCAESFTVKWGAGFLNWFPRLDSDMICKALRINPKLIDMIQYPNEDQQLAAVSTDGNTIQYINNPTDNAMIMAVKENCRTIRFIKNPPEEAQLMAVNGDPFSIQYIERPTEKTQVAAVKLNKEAMDYIKNPCDEVRRIYTGVKFVI